MTAALIVLALASPTQLERADDALVAWRACSDAHGALQDVRRVDGALGMCLRIAAAGQRAGLRERELRYLVAIGYHESRFRDVRGAAGEIGPLQALPRYWCPGGRADGCDPVDAGVRAWSTLVRQSRGDLELAAARYNGGFRRPSWGYAQRVGKRLRAMRQHRRAATWG